LLLRPKKSSSLVVMVEASVDDASSTRVLKYAMAVSALVVAVVGFEQAARWSLSPRGSAMANLFTGGLILSTSLVHLLAEAAERDDGGFPWACFLLGVGYGAMLSIEQFGRRRPESSSSSSTPSRSGKGVGPSSSVVVREVRAPTDDVDDEAQDDGESEALFSSAGGNEALRNPSSVGAGEGKRGGGGETSSRRAAAGAGHHLHHLHHLDGSAVATLALVVHSVGDGAAVALQSSRTKLTAVAGAILVHKFFAASALGTLLAKQKRQKTKRLVAAALFVLATPTTIVLVVVLGDAVPWGSFGGDGPAVDRATALCAGSLLYVGVHEILEDALESTKVSAPTKLGLFWLGFFLMSLLALWV